jgi:hypothetical protein
MAKNKLQVSFLKPIIDEAQNDRQVVCPWEPHTFGWIGMEDDTLVIFGSSRFSFIERWLSLGVIGDIFIRTLFSSIREKAYRVPYKSISKIVAATRPQRSSAWDGGDTECGIIHIMINESGKPQEVCAFTTSGTNADLSAFWDSCSNRLGAEKLDIRDEKMRRILLVLK